MRFALAFIGRHAAIAFALSIFLGLALPQLAATLRPAIPITTFCFIAMTFARANIGGVKEVLGQPRRLGMALLWTMIVPPLIGFGAIALLGPATMDPGLRLAIALMAAAPPLMASPAYAAMLGFENSLALAILVLATVLTPITSPLIANLLAGGHVPLEPAALALRLLLLIGGGIVVGLVVRRITGHAALVALKTELDGLSVVLFFLFAIAAMDGVIDAALANPLKVLAFLALSTLLSSLGFGGTYLAAARYGFNDRFTLAMGAGLRNMGLLIAPIISLVPPSTFLYFALAQIPIYVAPVVFKGLKARLEPAGFTPQRGSP